MISPSPDTRVDGDWGCGYALEHDTILGISHIHDWQLAGLLVMPMSMPWRGDDGRAALGSRFDRDRERCKPGDHRFVLERDGTAVELTATLRTAWHRYRFGSQRNRSVCLDLAGPLGPCEMAGARITAEGKNRFVATVVNLPTIRRSQPVRVWFVIEFQVMTSLEVWDGSCWSASQAAESDALRARLALPDGDEDIVMRVAVSYTSAKGAMRNLEAEAHPFEFRFDDVRADATEEWERWLSRVDASPVAERHLPRFYTDLFFALAGRRTCSDADGAWVDYQGSEPVVRSIPRDPGSGLPLYRHFNSDAFWGAQWSLIPMWLRYFPEVARDFCHCLYDYARHGGRIPRGPSGGRDTFVMTSSPTTPLFAAAMIQGVWQPDEPDAVFEALRANHLPGGAMAKAGYEHQTAVGGGVEEYIERGYVPEDGEKVGFHANGCAMTLEHAFNDHALACLAEHLGRSADAEVFRKRSRSWRDLFDKRVGFVRPKLRRGDWIDQYDPFSPTGMTEANGWTYTFYAAHDVEGMIENFGSPEAFLASLNTALTRSEEQGFFAEHGHHEQITMDFGNEPALAAPFLFAAAGDPSRARFWVDRILEKLKSGNHRADWYGGDEDQGIMGAWSVLARLGVFDLDGGCDPELEVRLSPSVDLSTVPD